MAKSKKNGFSLLEVMVVLSIVAVLSIGALSSYKSFNHIKSLESDTEAFVEMLELAKKNTTSGEKPCVAYQGKYRVTWENTSATLTPLGCAATTIFNLKGNQFYTAGSSIDFNPLGRGTTLIADTCVLIKNIYLNQCRQITIEKSGTMSHTINATCSCT